MPRPKRVIEILRQAYPGDWEYDNFLCVWIGPHFNVIPTSENYDEIADTHDIRYVRSDSGKVVSELLGLFKYLQPCK